MPAFGLKPKTSCSKAGFLNADSTAVSSWIILCSLEVSCTSQIFNYIFGLSPLEASHNLLNDNHKCFTTLAKVPWTGVEVSNGPREGPYSAINGSPKGMRRILEVLELRWESFSYLFSLTSIRNVTFIPMINVGSKHS